jgi:hypothetical protein
MRILVTGACGVTSRAIVRSLRLSSRYGEAYLVGTDICENPYGLYEGLLDSIYHAPRVNAVGYFEWMTDLCRSEHLDAAIVIPELEVIFWAARGFPIPALLPPARFCKIAGNKRSLYEALAGTVWVPRFRICSRAELLEAASGAPSSFPCWIRDFTEGASSGKGALLAHGPEEARAWAILNRGIEQFMLSEYLPGRNFACHLLYDRGAILKIACYERLEYFGARTAVSGITGNICRGRLVNDPRLVDVAATAIASIVQKTGETMHGIVAVDLREAHDTTPMITEINLRHVAATYAFAAAGFNLAEAHLALTLGDVEGLGPREAAYSADNIILRDIDGTPLWLDRYRAPVTGECVSKS